MGGKARFRQAVEHEIFISQRGNPHGFAKPCSAPSTLARNANRPRPAAQCHVTSLIERSHYEAIRKANRLGIEYDVSSVGPEVGNRALLGCARL